MTCLVIRFSQFTNKGSPAALFLLCLLISACSVIEPYSESRVEEARHDLAVIMANRGNQFGPKPDIPMPDELHRLSPEQVRQFQSFLDHPDRDHVPLHQRVYAYLDNLTGQFDYFEKTMPAMDALELKRGNCMSLAIITTALAQIAGIDTGYKLMDDVPVFEYQGNTVLKGLHLSTILYDPDWSQPADLRYFRRPGLQVDYFRSGRTRPVANVDRDSYLAMYYQNVAAENLEQGNLEVAYWYSLEALHYNPVYDAAINTLAIVHRRQGELDQAERLYRFALDRSRNNLSLLRNYHALLVYQDRNEAARRIARRIDQNSDASPYRWLALAREAESDGDFNAAINFYSRALTLAPYMHEIQLGIALANYRAGRLEQAEKALEKAVSLVPAPETRNLYATKLKLLKHELEN